MNKQKAYKPKKAEDNNNLRIVSMIPGDLKGLPDDFYINAFLKNLRGFDNGR